MKVRMQEKPKIAAAGANIELRKRPTRARLGMTGMVRNEGGIDGVK